MAVSTEIHAQIRRPAFSGLFYPADPSTLTLLIQQCLHNHAESTGERPRILIVPHAGYVFSGRVAGAGYAQVRDCSTVILLGVSHRDRFDTIAAYLGTSWQTPLGQVDVDRGMVNDLLHSCSAFRVDNDAHKYEHTLEVQLPFLQQVLENFRIVPLLLGSRHASHDVSAALARLFDDQTLLVVSSDLSHYPCQADAEIVDHQTIEAILSTDPDDFQKVITTQLRRGVPGLLTCACGAAAIEAALRVGQILHLIRPRMLAYQNSGHVTGDTHQVVGYTSIAFA